MKKEEIWECKKCGSKDFYTKPKGPHMGVYCSHCGTWLKWLKGGCGVKSKQNNRDEFNRSPVKTIIDAQSFKDEARHACVESLTDLEAPF